jgi:general secretion pathway protein H
MPVISETGSSGFTLLELMVVLAILVLLAGAWPLAAPHVFPTQRLRNEAQHFVSMIRAARITARMTGQPESLEIEPAGAGYRTPVDNRDLPIGMTLAVRGGAMGSRASALTLYPDGSSTGGTFELSLSSHLKTVRIGRLTGRAEIIE